MGRREEIVTCWSTVASPSGNSSAKPTVDREGGREVGKGAEEVRREVGVQLEVRVGVAKISWISG